METGSTGATSSGASFQNGHCLLQWVPSALDLVPFLWEWWVTGILPHEDQNPVCYFRE